MSKWEKGNAIHCNVCVYSMRANREFTEMHVYIRREQEYHIIQARNVIEIYDFLYAVNAFINTELSSTHSTHFSLHLKFWKTDGQFRIKSICIPCPLNPFKQLVPFSSTCRDFCYLTQLIFALQTNRHFTFDTGQVKENVKEVLINKKCSWWHAFCFCPKGF